MVWRWAIMGVSVAAVATCVAIGLERWQEGPERLAARLLEVKAGPEAPPPFQLETFDGGTWSLEAHAGKTVVVNFWATWCPPCIEEMPSLKRFVSRFQDHPDFVFVAVSADDGWEEVREFWPEGPPFTVALDEGGAMANQWGTFKFPESYIVRDGRVLGHIVGPRDWDTWYAQAYLESLLGPDQTERVAAR